MSKFCRLWKRQSKRHALKKYQSSEWWSWTLYRRKELSWFWFLTPSQPYTVIGHNYQGDKRREGEEPHEHYKNQGEMWSAKSGISCI